MRGIQNHRVLTLCKFGYRRDGDQLDENPAGENVLLRCSHLHYGMCSASSQPLLQPLQNRPLGKAGVLGFGFVQIFGCRELNIL